MNKPKLERILLVRLSALGDCMAAVPVFHALRKAYPQAHIAWAIQDNNAQLVQTLSDLDELIIFPRQRWKNMNSNKLWRKEFIQFARHVRLKKFQAAIDVQSNSKSAFIAWLSGAPIRIGHGYPEKREISGWLNNRKANQPESIPHIVERNLNLLSELGIKTETPDFTLPMNKPANRKMRSWLNEHQLEENNFILIVPFTAQPEKDYAPDRIIELAKKLTENHKVVLLNAPGKEQSCASLVENINHQNALLSSKMNISQLVELIRLSKIAIGGDTGPVQIAGAFGKPTFALFGPTDPKRSIPYGPSQAFSLEISAEDLYQKIIKVNHT